MAADDTSARFSLELSDGITPGATSAEDALTQLAEKLTSGQKELSQLNAAMRKLKQGGLSGSQAAKQLGDRINALKKGLGVAQAQFIHFGGDITTLGQKVVPPTSDALGDMAGQLSKMGGPMAAIGGRMTSMLANPAAAAAAALLAVGAAMVAFVAAVAAGAAALLRFGLAAREARRSELLHLEGLTTIRRWHGVAAGSATELQRSIDRVSGSAAIGRSQVAGYAEQLYRAGLRGQTLEDALRGVSTVAAVQGEEMANRFRGMAIAAARTGRSVSDLTARVERRLGPIASRMALGWGRQMERLRESWNALFDDLQIEGLLAGLNSIVSMFSQASFEGRALRQIFTSVFQPFIDGSTRSGPLFKRFLQGVIIAALELAIVFVRVKNWIRDTFSGSSLAQLTQFTSATDLGRYAVYGFAIALGACVVAFAALATMSAVAVAALVAPIALIGGLIHTLIETDWTSIGRSLIDGLISGLTGGAHRVVSAVRSLGASMTSALRTALDIHSPSRVFADLGRQIPRGLAVGVEAEAGTAQGAVSDVVSVPAGGALSSGGLGGGQVAVSIDGGIHVHVARAEDVPESIADRISEAIASALEGAVVQMGGAR